MENNHAHELFYSAGNAFVCCQACILKKSHSCMFFFVLFLILALPLLLFFGIVLRIDNRPALFAFGTITVFLLLCAVAAYISTACSDPGTLPRRLDMPDYPPSDKKITISGHEFELKICATCHIVRPLRSFHCNFCDACIEEHDHHCPWVNNCVGRRNHRSFVYFLLVATLFFIDDFAACIFKLCESVDYVSVIISSVLFVFCFFLFCSSSGLLCGNCYFIVKGVTTNEMIRGRWDEFNPFDAGCRKNCGAFFCRSLGPSIIDRLPAATASTLPV